MTHSRSIAKIAPALVNFQRDVRSVLANRQGERTPFADWNFIRETVRPLLGTNHLAVVQAGGYDTIETIIFHLSGEWIGTTATCGKSVNGDVQYGARHALLLALGVTEYWDATAHLPEPDGYTVELTPEEIVERNRNQKRRKP